MVLVVLAVARAIVDPTPGSWLTLGLLVAVGVAAFRHRLAVRAMETGRRIEAESFARILQGLSRSISPDAIMDAIVEELGVGTGADHVVVARRRPDSRVLEATLVNARTGGPSSTTIFPISDLEDPPTMAEADRREPLAIPIEVGTPVMATPAGGPMATGPAMSLGVGGLAAAVATVSAADAQERVDSRTFARPRSVADAALVAERIAKRARRVYGLKHTLVAPLTVGSGVIGAIVVSRRTADPWPAAAQRMLAGATAEASAALSRAYSHRQAEARAATDALTGLPNRRYFDEYCALLSRRRRAEDAIGILMVDIDRFKALIDTHGHAVGDEVLRSVAGAIAGAVREDDVPARYGGEEFAVVLRNPSRDEAVEVGERIREAVASLDLRRMGVAATSVSVGVAVADEPGRLITEVIERADQALFEDKRKGRDRVIAA